MIEFDDLKAHPVEGITTTSYDIYVKMPKRSVSNPEAGIGINPYIFNETSLQECGLFSRKTSIERVNKTSVVVKFTVAEPYLKKFYGNLIKAESTELIKEQ